MFSTYTFVCGDKWIKAPTNANPKSNYDVQNINKSRMHWFANPFQPRFYLIHFKVKIFKAVNVIVILLQIFTHYNASNTKKNNNRKRDRASLPLCYITSPFINNCQDTICGRFVRGILSHSSLKDSFSCSTIQGLYCRILHFIMCHPATKTWEGGRGGQ